MNAEPRNPRSVRFDRFPGRQMAFGIWLAVLIAISGADGCSREQAEDVPQLVENLGQADPNARYSAVKSLGNRGAEAKEAVPEMIRMLKDSDSAVRTGTAYALGKLGPAAASAVPALMAALDDPKKDVRLAAAYSLPALGPEAVAAWDALRKTANQDREPTVRQEAAKSLAKIEVAFKYRRAPDDRTAEHASGGRP